jgi:hypothetical protein
MGGKYKSATVLLLVKLDGTRLHLALHVLGLRRHRIVAHVQNTCYPANCAQECPLFPTLPF